MQHVVFTVHQRLLAANRIRVELDDIEWQILLFCDIVGCCHFLIDMCLGVSCFCLHVLLYRIASLVLYTFSLTYLYWSFCVACWALTNVTFCGPCIVIYLRNKDQKIHCSFLIYFSNLFTKCSTLTVLAASQRR